MNVDWTKARIAQLTTLWAAHHTATEIAKIMGIETRSAVLGKVHRLQLPPRAISARPKATPKVKAPAKARATKPPKPVPAAGSFIFGSGRKREQEEARPTIEVLSPRPLTMLELPLRGACRWIVDTDLCLSCGNSCGEDTYCAGHHAIAFTRARVTADQLEAHVRYLERRPVRDPGENFKPWVSVARKARG